MRQKMKMAVLVLALGVVVITPGILVAQVSLQDQLSAQYKVVKMGTDSSGAAVVEEGTILVVKKGGILGTAYTDTNIFATHYENGAVHSPNPLGQKALGFGLGKLGKQAPTTQFFQANVKVYPSKITVNLPKDQVIIGIIDCDSCNNVDPKTFFKADVVFQFPHGTLATANPSNVEDTIAGLLATDDSGGDQGNNQQGGNQQGGNGNNQGGNNQGGGGGNGGGGGGQTQQDPPQEPQQIEKGQTPDQVKAAIGTPDKIVNLGAKQIYVYKDIKVTFLNGKVSDVQ